MQEQPHNKKIISKMSSCWDTLYVSPLNLTSPLTGQPICLNKVRVLSVQNCKISSISQIFSRCYMPILSNVDLSRNFIMQLKDLRKIQSPHIQILKIDDNCLCQFDSTSEIHAKKVLNVIADAYTSQTWFVKLQSSQLVSATFSNTYSSHAIQNKIMKQNVRKEKAHFDLILNFRCLKKAVSGRCQTNRFYLTNKKKIPEKNLMITPQIQNKEIQEKDQLS